MRISISLCIQHCQGIHASVHIMAHFGKISLMYVFTQIFSTLKFSHNSYNVDTNIMKSENFIESPILTPNEEIQILPDFPNFEQNFSIRFP